MIGRATLRHAAITAAANLALGFGLAGLLRALAVLALGLAATPGETIALGLAIALRMPARSAVLRRLFDRLGAKAG